MKTTYMIFSILIIIACGMVAVSCGGDDDDDDDDSDDAQSGDPGCCYWAGDDGAVFDSDSAESSSDCSDMAEEAVNDPDSVASEYVAENAYCEDEELAPTWWG